MGELRLMSASNPCQWDLSATESCLVRVPECLKEKKKVINGNFSHISTGALTINPVIRREYNFYILSFLAWQVLANGLRNFFKEKWNEHYASRFGMWQDTAQNVMDFFDIESSTRSFRRINQSNLITILKQHAIKEMDFSRLFMVIVYSESISRCLSDPEKVALCFLREFRNKVAHGLLPESDKFNDLLGQCLAALEELNISSEEVVTSIRKKFPSLGIVPVASSLDIDPVVRKRYLQIV